MMSKEGWIVLVLILVVPITLSRSYPIDGYAHTNIRRLKYLELVQAGEIKGKAPVPGATKSIDDIHLQLDGEHGAVLSALPAPDPAFQKAINGLFPNLNENYSISVLDITPGRPFRLAQRRELVGYQPGSVGKLAVVAGFFTELARIYPDSWEKRQDLLCTRMVRGGQWAMTDSHTVLFFDLEELRLVKRTLKPADEFLLYEWLDHMLSVSNNGAASVCWREAILMRVFGAGYPTLSEEAAEAWFRETPKSELADIANAVVNEPLRRLGISEDEWRLGQLFTRGGTSYIPPKGGSIGTPNGLMKFLVALERGVIVDASSSLEIKRLLYMTDRRIRYANAPALRKAAVYFKSGSLYKCAPEEGYVCEKYKGNVDNFMNSVAIVEHPDGVTYLVALMSNVRKKNSNLDHMALAASIDKLVRKAP
ncbi:MAG TPA: hypothetical protein P5563_04530 [Saprospiraceae bacterium]|nr:hypothetical protein [Saprospiraceae bacterium]